MDQINLLNQINVLRQINEAEEKLIKILKKEAETKDEIIAMQKDLIKDLQNFKDADSIAKYLAKLPSLRDNMCYWYVIYIVGPNTGAITLSSSDPEFKIKASRKAIERNINKGGVLITSWTKITQEQAEEYGRR